MHYLIATALACKFVYSMLYLFAEIDFLPQVVAGKAVCLGAAQRLNGIKLKFT